MKCFGMPSGGSPFFDGPSRRSHWREKLLGVYLDGKVVCALGTHTHVPTADEEILAGGTAFLSDVGMTGPSKGVLGRKYESILSSVLTGLPQPYEVAQGNIHLCGALVEWMKHPAGRFPSSGFGNRWMALDKSQIVGVFEKS